MNLQGYDFEEEAIRDMVESNHVPGEMVTGTTRWVICAQDRDGWPCSVVIALREWRQETGKLD
jgi:hypothetical protein